MLSRCVALCQLGPTLMLVGACAASSPRQEPTPLPDTEHTPEPIAQLPPQEQPKQEQPPTRTPIVFAPEGPAQTVPGEADCHHADAGWVCFLGGPRTVSMSITAAGEIAVATDGSIHWFGPEGVELRAAPVPEQEGRSRKPLDLLGLEPGLVWAGEECGAEAGYPEAEPQSPQYSGQYCSSAVVGLLDSEGRELTTWGFGTSGGIDRVSAVSAAPEGDLYVAGQFAGPLVVPGLEPIASGGHIELFLLRADLEGRTQWARTWGSPMDDGDGPQVATLSDGSAVVASHPAHEVEIERVDPQGESLWRYTLDGFASAFGLAVGPQDTIYVAGIREFRGYVLSLTPDGEVRWLNIYGEGGDEVQRVIAVAADVDGSIWAHGAYESKSSGPPATGWLRKLGPDGEVLAPHAWDGLWPGVRHSVAVTPQGDPVVIVNLAGARDLGLLDSGRGAGGGFVMLWQPPTAPLQ